MSYIGDTTFLIRDTPGYILYVWKLVYICGQKGDLVRRAGLLTLGLTK